MASPTATAITSGSYRPSARHDEWPWPGRSIATAGRPSASSTPSQVWAFSPPPCRSTSSGSPAAPDERADLAVAGLHRLPPDQGSVVEMDPQFGRLLIQEGEFIRVEQLGCHVSSALGCR